MKTQKRKPARIFWTVGVFCMLIFALSFLNGHTVSAADKREVKVAFYPLEGYHVKNSDGSYSGVEVEYLQLLSTYTDWDIKYVECATWKDALDKLEHHQVDLVGAGQYTEERAEKYLFADVPNNYIFSAVATKSDADIAFEDFSRMKDLRYGIVDGYVKTDEFYEYFRKNGIENPNVTVYPTSNDLHQALENDEIDAIVHTFMEVRKGQRVIGRFASNTTYFMTYYGNEELMDELNGAITDIKYQHPMLEYELMQKYYESKWDDAILFTSGEMEYLNQTDEIVIGYVDGYFPFNYEENGELKGIVKDTLTEQNLPLRFQKVNTAEEGIQGLQDGTIDVMTHMTDTELLNSSKQLQVLCNYADVPFVFVMGKDRSMDSMETIVTLSDFRDELERMIVSEDKVIKYENTMADCFDSLVEGEADACLGTAYVSEYFIRTLPKYNDLTISSVLNASIPIHMVVNENADDALKSIISKSIGHINEKEITEYMLEHIEPAEISLEAFTRKNYRVIMEVLLLIIMIVLGVTIHIVQDSRKIQKLLFKDAGMDIWNLHYFIKKVDEKRKHVISGSRGSYAIVYTNITRMRQYHLVYGRNSALKVYECLKNKLKEQVADKQEVCARVSDDHFLMLLKYDSLENLELRLKGIALSVEEAVFQLTDNQLQLEMGVVPDIFVDKDAATLVECAIQVLDGKNEEANRNIYIYNNDFEKRMMECHKKEQMLESVSIEDHFEVYYQNKVDIRTEKIVGAEALIRYRDPLDHDKIKSPFYFIPYMEQIGRVVELDFFVLNSVCKMLRRRLDAGLSVVPVSCNFSRLHFIQPGFADRFEKIVSPYRLPQDLIEVEITETMVVEQEHMETINQNIRDMKEKGIRIAIDDFGSGYSSLGVFEHVPAAVIKMDRSFMVNRENGERQITIMKGIVKLSEELNAEIVCEGVETEEDVQLMHNIATYIAQGYFYSRPRPEKEFEAMLDEQKKTAPV